MFLVAYVVALQVSEQCYGNAADLSSVAEVCPAWDPMQGGCQIQDVHGRRLMQLDSFVTRLARQHMDHGSNHGRSEAHPDKHSRSEDDDQSSREDQLEGNLKLDNNGRNLMSKRPPPRDITSEERSGRKDHRDPDGKHRPSRSSAKKGNDASKAPEQFHMMALRPASTRSSRSASIPHDKAAHALAEGSHAESKASTSSKTKSPHHDANPMHQERSTAHAHSRHAHAGPELEERDSLNAKSVKKTKASETEFENDDKAEVPTTRHQLHAQEHKASRRKKAKSHSLLNPAIMTVMFLMSAPAGMLLIAFGSLLWAKSHGDVSMGGS